MIKTIIKIIITTLFCLAAGTALAMDELPQPEFIRTDFLGLEGIADEPTASCLAPFVNWRQSCILKS